MTRTKVLSRAGLRGLIATVATLGAALIVVAWPRHATAQDVLIQGREAAVQPPAWILRVLAQDPMAFRFQRAWKAKAAAVRARRSEIAATLGANYTRGRLTTQGASMDGVMYIPVIPALYSDLSAPHVRSRYQERLFGDGSGAVSVTGLYSEMSLGVFSITGTVLPWLDMPHPRSYYEPAGETYGELAAFLRDALLLADPKIDFGEFDNDGRDGIPNSGDDDGYVDVAAFIYATVAQSCGGTGSGIWPHRWTYSSAQYFAGGRFAPFFTSDASANGGVILVDDYIIQSGVQCDGESIMGSGTISHELGHALDLPDLYDTDREDGTNSQGIGYWGLMGSGGWNKQVSPAHMSAWSKDRMGWLDVTVVERHGTRVSLRPIQRDGSVVRIDVPGSREHFLVANRQRLGSDEHLPEPGLLVWHIDPVTIEERDRFNRVNADANHKGVDLEEADGKNDLDFAERRNRGDAGDPFPGATGATVFASTSHPSSHSYGGGSSCTVGIRSIRATGSLVSFEVNPSERLRILGDANGDDTVNEADVDEINWYALGWRGGEIDVENADVDADGDTDIRDAFLIHSHLSGYSVPVSSIGSERFVYCNPNAAIAAPQPSGEGGLERVPAVGSGRKGGSQ